MEPLARARLGATDVYVTRLGLGTAPLGGWPSPTTPSTASETIRAAVAAGVAYFDTAPFYGHGLSETWLGRALDELPRDAFRLSTKVGRLLVEREQDEPALPSLFAGAPPLTPVFDFSYDGVMRSLEESRRRLGSVPIDIALIHDPDDAHDEAMAGAYIALKELRERGDVAAIGVGMNSAAPLERFAHEGDFDCFLLAGRYTLLEQESALPLLDLCAARGISIIAGGVYNSGLLADPSEAAHYDYAPAASDLVERARLLERACNAFDVPLRAAAIQFPLGHPAVASVVVGARTPAEMLDNLSMFRRDVPLELWDHLKHEGLVAPNAPTPRHEDRGTTTGS